MSSINVKSCLLPVMGLLSVSQLSAKAEASLAKQPNVIFLITDDQGYGDLACHGNSVIKTPNLDKLHSESTRFTNYHVSPTSAPTRSALMTGRYSNRVGVWHTIGGRSLMWHEEVTIAQELSANGYVCGLFGKWHLGDNYPMRPQDKGFSEVLMHGGGGICQATDYWGNDYFDDTFHHNGKWEKYEGYCTDVFFDEAMKFIEENKEKPFFCYLPVNAPHAPFNVPEKYYNLYKDREDLLDVQKQFYGMITNIDDNYGRLAKKLKQLKLEDNTIIVFMTDNGSSCGFRRVDGRYYGYNAGMRGTKASQYEGGHRVPFFIKGQGIAEGVDIDKLCSHVDIMPTFIDLLGVEKQLPTKPLDGVSLKPLMLDSKAPWQDRVMIVDAQRRLNLVKWLRSSVMTQRWRLIEGKELYDMDVDPSQTKNVAAKHPEVVEELRAHYLNQWQEYIDAGILERYSYIKVGTPFENPTWISAHDMLVEQTKVHVQTGTLTAENSLGVTKLEVTTAGKYKFSLHRYPKESDLCFDANVAQVPQTIEVKGSPNSRDVEFKTAVINVAQYSIEKRVDMSAKSVEFILDLTEGKYDLFTYFVDELSHRYPIYNMYVEKL